MLSIAVLLFAGILSRQGIFGSTSQLFPRKGGGGGGHGGGGGRGGTGSSGKSSSSGISSTSSVSGFGSDTVSSGSRGGGKAVTLPSTSPFSGRLSGGANRDSIFGTNRIGSGYPYGGSGSFVGGRGFPYGFYPVYYPSPYGDYYGTNEYGPSANATRPGGELSTAVLLPTVQNSSFPNSSFYIFGDKHSVSDALKSIVSECSISNTSVLPAFGSSSGISIVHPEQIVQYYRASSFALGLSAYNNTAAFPANAPATNTSAVPPPTADTPLPGGYDPVSLECINRTIGKNVLLLDVRGRKLSDGEVTGITIGCVIFVILVIIVLSKVTQ